MRTWDLKYCPHCASGNLTIRVIEREYVAGEDEYYVLCKTCGSSSGRRVSPEAAVYLWNDRQESDEILTVAERED